MTNPKFKKILDTLAAGNTRFVSGQSRGADTSPAFREKLAGGQHPLAAVIACADARVSPEIIFDLGLGDLFVVRTAGNLVGRLGRESIAYAVEHLGVPVVLILGHTHCGAVTAAANLDRITPDAGKIPNALKPAVEAAHHFSRDPVKGTVLANITQLVDTLRRMQPFAARVAAQTLQIQGAIYHLEDGTVRFL